MIITLLLCFYLVSAQQNISSVIVAAGYPLEVHEVMTSDGFYLQLLRVPHGKTGRATKGPILLQHGLGSSCADWFLNDPTESLGFLLADMGYDVWAGNNRGNGYSMKHKIYNSSQKEFWYWTWDSMASIDLPTEIDYILQVTQKPKLAYIGISQGTCQVFAGLSENHALAQKMSIFIALAPVSYVFNQRSTLFYILAELDLDEIELFLGDTESSLSEAVRKFLPGLCGDAPSVCEQMMALIMGPSSHLNGTRFPFYMEYEIAPTSVWNFAHWAQGVRNNVYQKMDWGQAGNIKHYGQPTPPPYNLANFPSFLPYALFTGGNDYLADGADVEHLLKLVPKQPVQVVYQPTYAHADYVLADTAWKDIYPQLFALLQKYAQ